MSSYPGQEPPPRSGSTDQPSAGLGDEAQPETVAVAGLVVGGLGLLAVLVCSFLPYYRVAASYAAYSDTHSTNAWDSWASIVGVSLLLLGCLTVTAAASRLLRGLGQQRALVGGAAATSLALLFCLVSAFSWSDYSAWKHAVSGTGVSMSQTREVGFYLILLLAVAIAALSWARAGRSWHARTNDHRPR